MKTNHTFPIVSTRPDRQSGLALFFALVALVALSLAALVLVRSVDTATLISGNLAFRRAATSTGDTGVDAATILLSQIQAANAGQSPVQDATHPFNNDNPAIGYYSNANPLLNLTSAANWVDGIASAESPVDASGNSFRYIIQRMCRDAGQLQVSSNCLLAGGSSDEGSHTGPIIGKDCDPGNPLCQAGQASQYRITVRVTGPRNTLSYIQAIAH